MLSMISTHKKYLLVLLLIALFALMVVSFRWGLSDIYAHQTVKQLEHWQQEKPEHIENTRSAMQWIQKARKLDPKNPDLMNYQAQVFEWQARLSSHKEASRELLESAAQLYRSALSRRPTWPFDWVALLDIKAQLNQFDNEFSQALERSSSLGPWEYPVQLRLVNTGFKHWSKLTSTEQDMVQQTFDRALHGIRLKPFIRLGEQYDQLELFCARSSMGETHHKVIYVYACKQFD